MHALIEIFHNRTLLLCIIAWFAAQVIKLAVALVKERKLDVGRLVFGLGGMPSSHSAVVCCLATTLGMHEGFATPLFALACMLAFIVMVDAAGVRLETGRQAALLNQIVGELIENGRLRDQKALKELIGHTPVQVIAGAILGVLIAVIAG